MSRDWIPTRRNDWSENSSSTVAGKPETTAPIYLGAILPAIAAAFHEAGFRDDAINVLRYAVDVNPDAHWVIAHLAKSLVSFRRYDEAEPYLRRLLEVEEELPKPIRARTHFHLGHALLFQRKHDAAIEHYERGLEIAPEHRVAAYIRISENLATAGNLDRAIDYLSQAIDAARGDRRRESGGRFKSSSQTSS